MAHRAAPTYVSVALGHTSASAVKATAGGCSTGSSACLTFPLLGRAPDEKAVMHLFVNIAINAAVPELDYLAICGLILPITFNVYTMIFRIK